MQHGRSDAFHVTYDITNEVKPQPLQMAILYLT
jgi:hypothetical protein